MGMPLTLDLLTVPFFAVWALLFGLGFGLWLAALNMLYRDINQGLGYALQLAFFISPIVYPTEAVPARFRDLYHLNPVVGIIDGFRWAFLQKGDPLDMVDVDRVRRHLPVRAFGRLGVPPDGARLCGYRVMQRHGITVRMRIGQIRHIAIRTEKLGKMYRLGVLSEQKYSGYDFLGFDLPMQRLWPILFGEEQDIRECATTCSGPCGTSISRCAAARW